MLMQCVACELPRSNTFLWLYWKIILLTVLQVVGLSLKWYALEEERREIHELSFDYDMLQCSPQLLLCFPVVFLTLFV